MRRFTLILNIFRASNAQITCLPVATNTIIKQGIVNYTSSEGQLLITEMVELVGNAQLRELEEIIASNPLVLG